MISNQVIQSTIDGISQITGYDIRVYDKEINILAHTDGDDEDFSVFVETFLSGDADDAIITKMNFFKIYDDNELEFVLIICADDDNAKLIGQMAKFQIGELLVAYKDRYDKDNFIKNLLLDNLLYVDILNSTKRLHIHMHTRRIVMIIETEKSKDNTAIETVRGLFVSNTGTDFITAVDDKDIIVVHEVDDETTYEDIDKLAHVIVDMLGTEVMTDARASYGTFVNHIKEVSKTYKEAKMALDVGRIFYSDRKVMAYSNLGIGRLIYQLPLPLCKMFIGEIFENPSIEQFDEETLMTIGKFFDDNLNVSKTSRDLYIHRNTLVYRLNKLRDATGLDIQTFDDAITFQIALMVMRYMAFIEQ